MSRFLAVLGLVITAIYIAFIYWLVGNPIPELKGAPLNNVGDFLAGVFGPVAIFWLILGFFQQGLELRQNNQALILQAEELKNSVEQQREMVAITRDQVAAELDALQHSRTEAWRALQPIFDVQRGGGSHSGAGHTLNLSITNYGAPVTNASAKFAGPFASHSISARAFNRNDSVNLKVSFTGTGQGLSDQLQIGYTDTAGNPGAYFFYVEVDTSGEQPTLRITKIH